MIDSYADTLVNIWIVLTVPFHQLVALHEDWQVGTTALVNSEEKQTSGTKCGKRLGALRLEFSLI